MQTLAYHTASLEVQFSGNARTYHYLCTAGQWVQATQACEQKRELRAVVPGKIKDGRLSLSIVTVLSATPGAHPDAVLPIVSLVPGEDIAFAKAAVMEAEQKSAALAAAGDAA